VLFKLKSLNWNIKSLLKGLVYKPEGYHAAKPETMKEASNQA
jgi:hypothetical protein